MEKSDLSVMTGATGHVGYALLKELSENNERVRILIRKDSSIFDGIDCEKVFADISDYESLETAFDGAKTVYHLAGIVEIKPGNEDEVRKINIEGTRNVIKACQECKVKRLVYMSSVDAYKPLPNSEKMTEVSKFDADAIEGIYAKTKAEATNLVFENQGVKGLDVVVLYPSACIGPYDFKVSSVGQMVRLFMKGLFPVSLGFGSYNFVDVRDVAKGTYAAAKKGKPGEGYILSGETVSVDRFIKILAGTLGKRTPSFKMSRPVIAAVAPVMEVYYKVMKKPPLFTRYAVRKLVSNCNFCCEKAKRDLGFEPMSPEESVKDMVKWIQDSET